MLKFAHMLVPSLSFAGGGRHRSTTVVIDNTAALALNTTPVVLIPAPLAGFAHIVTSVAVVVDAAAGAFTESGNNLQVRYVDESGTVIIDAEATAGLIAASINFGAYGAGDFAAGVLLTAVDADPVVVTTATADWGGGNAANTVTVFTHFHTLKVA